MKKASGINYLILAVLAFASVGLELLLAFGAEPVLYGGPTSQWTDMQNIMHWIFTCILWGTASWFMIRFAKKKYGKHRSVTLANELYAEMKERGNYGVKLYHRDIKQGV